MVRTIEDMPEILALVAGLGWLVADLAQDQFAV